MRWVSPTHGQTLVYDSQFIDFIDYSGVKVTVYYTAHRIIMSGHNMLRTMFTNVYSAVNLLDIQGDIVQTKVKNRGSLAFRTIHIFSWHSKADMAGHVHGRHESNRCQLLWHSWWNQKCCQWPCPMETTRRPVPQQGQEDLSLSK